MPFWDQYVPHVQLAAGKCSAWGAEVLTRLDQIAYAAQTEEPSLVDKMIRATFVLPAAGSVDLDKVPMNQAWTIGFVASTAAWRINLNGSLFMTSTNSFQYGDQPVLLPGEVATIVAVAGTEVSVQMQRRLLDGHPRRARSGSGNENWNNGTSTRRETARDILQVGPAPHHREAVIREN